MSVLRLLLKDDLNSTEASPIYEFGGEFAVYQGAGHYDFLVEQQHRVPLVTDGDAEIEAFFLSVLKSRVPVTATASRDDWHEVFHELTLALEHKGPFALVVPERMRRWPMPPGVSEYVCVPEVDRVYVLPAPCQYLGVMPMKGGKRGCAIQDIQDFRCMVIDSRLLVLDEWLSAPPTC